jgi:zinc protease
MKSFFDKKRRIARLGWPVFLLCVWMAVYALVPGCLSNISHNKQTPAYTPETGALLPDPAVIKGELDNGFRYVLMKNKRPEDRVDMHLVVEAGSLDETDDQQGLAHYLEHMLFNGTTHFPPGELIKYFQSIGMGFGNDVNAHTGFFRTVYDLHLPSGDADHLREGLLVMTDYAAGALLLESEVDRERGIILAEKRTRDSVSYRTFKATLDFELAGSRFIRRYPIGKAAVLETAGAGRLRSFYDTWYRPERMTLVVVGDFDPETAAGEITEAFSGLTPRAPQQPVPDIGHTSHDGVNVLYHYEDEAGSTDVTLETLVQEQPPPDSVEAKKERFIRNMAYRIVNYRLDELEERPDPPFTSAEASAGDALKYYSYAAISATAAPEKWEQALSAVENVLRSVLEYGFTRSEVERAQREVLAEMDRAVLQSSTRQSNRLASEIMMDMSLDRVFQSPEQERILLAPVAESLTPDMLHQAFKATWAPESRLILVTGNARIGGNGDAEAVIRSAWRRSRDKAVLKPDEKKIQRFPYLPDPAKKGRVAREMTDKDIGVTRIDFENSVRLNLKKTDFKANQVVAELRFGKGESTEPAAEPALCELGEEALNESGFGGMKKEDLRLALAGKKAGFSFSVDPDRFRLTGTCASDEIPLLFQLFYTFYQDWACRDDAYRLSLERFRQGYEEKTHTIEGAMVLKGNRFLAGGDSRFGWPPDFEAFEEVGPDRIRDWIKNALRQSWPEISIVGDFDPRQVIDAAALYFGSMDIPVTPDPEDASRPGPFVPSGELKVLNVPTEIDKAYVEVAWPTADFWNVGRTRRLLLLARVFSDRMRLVIREEAGQTYSQYAYHAASLVYPGYGVFHAAAEIKPEDADTVISAIKAIAVDIMENGVTEEELARAREPILTGIGELVKTNDYWLRSVLSGCRAHPERLEWSRNLLSDYQAMTAGELTQLARQYLDVSRCAVVIVKPDSATGNNS